MTILLNSWRLRFFIYVKSSFQLFIYYFVLFSFNFLELLISKIFWLINFKIFSLFLSSFFLFQSLLLCTISQFIILCFFSLLEPWSRFVFIFGSFPFLKMHYGKHCIFLNYNNSKTTFSNHIFLINGQSSS